MSFLRNHWFDLGIALAVLVGGFVLVTRPTGLALLLWLSLIALFVHQFEEYRYPGYFPGVLNSALFSSRQPDRYPLNAQSALVVNVVVGWLFYVLAALFNTQALWLGIATLLVSLGNVVVHTFLFNIKGRTIYNPGLLTAVALFLPLAVYFYSSVIRDHAASPLDWVVGVALGLALNYVGVIKLIEWLSDEQSPYAFAARSMVPKQRRAAPSARPPRG